MAILYWHLDQSAHSGSTSLIAIPKPCTVHKSPTEPVTALGFCKPTNETPAMYLFIATTSCVLVYQASGHGSGGTVSKVHEAGAALGCAIMDWKACNMVIAYDEVIFLCGVENRGSSYVYEGMQQVSLSYVYADFLFRSQDLCAHAFELSSHCLPTPDCQCNICLCNDSELCFPKHGCQWHQGHQGHHVWSWEQVCSAQQGIHRGSRRSLLAIGQYICPVQQWQTLMSPREANSYEAGYALPQRILCLGIGHWMLNTLSITLPCRIVAGWHISSFSSPFYSQLPTAYLSLSHHCHPINTHHPAPHHQIIAGNCGPIFPSSHVHFSFSV